MYRRALAVTTLAAALGFGVAACGDDDLSTDDMIEQMVDEGMPRDQAECVIAELGDDAERLGNAADDPADLSAEDGELVTNAITSCVEIPATSTP